MARTEDKSRGGPLIPRDTEALIKGLAASSELRQIFEAQAEGNETIKSLLKKAEELRSKNPNQSDRTT